MGFSETMHYYWVEMADSRTNAWPIVASAYYVPGLIFAYLYFVLRCGPRFMEKREPYSLKTFMKFYNIFQIISNMLIVYNLIKGGWFTELGLYCEPIIYTFDRGPYLLAKVMWWTLLLKLFDFVETGIFVLRKRDRQISFLHLYHHISTVLLQWLGAKYVAGGMPTFLVLVNCIVHVIMYTYYYLSNYGPSVRSAIAPFKPMITIIQMVQFVILMIYTIQGLHPDCNMPKVASIVFFVNLMVNFQLFYNFYKQTYETPKAKKA